MKVIDMAQALLQRQAAVACLLKPLGPRANEYQESVISADLEI
jgi:hypothetical protein